MLLGEEEMCMPRVYPSTLLFVFTCNSFLSFSFRAAASKSDVFASLLATKKLRRVEVSGRLCNTK
jgi:hypothetical protein